jgi:hypothetical protein
VAGADRRIESIKPRHTGPFSVAEGSASKVRRCTGAAVPASHVHQQDSGARSQRHVIRVLQKQGRKALRHGRA